MPCEHNLSGRWKGYYTRHDQQRPISVTFDQNGPRLAGSMEDACTAFQSTLSELAMAEGLPPGADERIVASIRSAYPDVPAGPVVAEIQLSPISSLSGEVNGRTVRFLKTYHGPHFAGYRIGDVRLGVLGADQEVLYQGQINDDGTEIEGHWRLPSLPHPLWIARIEGGFWLRRAEGSDDDAGFELD